MIKIKIYKVDKYFEGVWRPDEEIVKFNDNISITLSAYNIFTIDGHGDYVLIVDGLTLQDLFINSSPEDATEIDYQNDYQFRILVSDHIRLSESMYSIRGRLDIIDLKNHKPPALAREDAYHAMKMEAEEQCNTIIDKYQTASIVFSQKLTTALYILGQIDKGEDIKFDLALTFARQAKREKKSIEKIAKNIVREYKIVGVLHDALNDVVINTIKFIDDTVVTDDTLTEVGKSMRINELVQGAKEQMKIDYDAIVNPPKVKVKKPAPKPAETTPVDEAPVPDVSGESNDE